MKKITLCAALMLTVSLSRAQLGTGLEGVIVEKYYLSNSADSINADNNGAVSPLHKGSTTYRVFIDMAPGWKFNTMFGNSDPNGNTLHPLIIKTTTDFYNDPVYGQVYSTNTSTLNIRKNTAMIDSWLSVGGACLGKMAVPKYEDTDGSLGNINGILINNAGGVYAPPINSVVAQPTLAADGIMPGQPLSPNYLGPSGATDIFDQTPGSTFSLTNGAVAGLGGVVGTTTSNVVLIGQFTTNGAFSFSLNISIQNTVTNAGEVYVPSNATGTEFTFTALAYPAAGTNTTTNPPPPPPPDTTGIKDQAMNSFALSIYPNPTKGVFTISAVDLKESTSNFYSVYDITGRMIFTKQMGRVSGKFVETVDIAHLADGLYFLNVSLDGAVSTRKVVKE